ncbi:MarR family winged helix-turn-helix transcriptional regulator [Fusibacter ferrireducens]|uniref:MarR family transcriptional regulator n=1 Tax=Fusibacter ferrireducens TaxID=2785058 RepID=A0ABR9ZNT3_9FIRM|nr:MarR family transcriptional regulator [Fusibacter ferrireducens]MBF4692128.1 MarR family transcriptional regulator [Fusibacter ferrireducens]
MENKNRKILRNIHTASRSILYIRNISFSKYGLQRGQHTFLTRIVENPGITQEDISLLLRIDRTTTAKAVKKIEAKGLIIRKKSTTDRRAWCLYPTEALMAIYSDIDNEIVTLSEKCTENFSTSEIDMLNDLLEKYMTNVNREWANTKNNI